MNLTRIYHQMKIAYISALLLKTTVVHLYTYSMLLTSLLLDMPILVLTVLFGLQVAVANCSGPTVDLQLAWLWMARHSLPCIKVTSLVQLN